MKNIIEHELKNLTLPVFELSVFILPEGKMRLRIFETKYLKMLSMISSHQMFVIQLTSKPAGAEHNNWGSLVKIKDFNQGEDGVLEIEVHCCALVQLADITLDKNNLVFGKITYRNHWSQNSTDENMTSLELGTALNDIINNNTLLNHLYQYRSLNNTYWVTARWLELLPVSLKIKSQFAKINTFTHAKDFVDSIIYK